MRRQTCRRVCARAIRPGRRVSLLSRIRPPLWERQLVWLKNAGIQTVVFSVPRNWHEPAPGAFDFTGRANPRRDLAALIHLLRRVGLQAWVRTGPPVEGWSNRGVAPRRDRPTPFLKALSTVLAPQTANHGGPVAWAEPPLPGVRCPHSRHRQQSPASPPPIHQPCAESRDALSAARGAPALDQCRTTSSVSRRLDARRSFPAA